MGLFVCYVGVVFQCVACVISLLVHFLSYYTIVCVFKCVRVCVNGERII